MPVDPDEYEDQWGSFEFESGGGPQCDEEGESFAVDESERYLRGHVLGWGGMGQVWIANDLRLNRDVALKEGSEDGVAREARITARLEHPGIVPVYDAGRVNDRPWYVMRLIRGRSLQFELSACRGLGERLRYISAFRDVCNAVAYAHQAGVVHRDLKPDNVMLGEFGETQVVDWGLALSIDPSPGPQPPMGTPMYMSPEQFEGGEPDPRSDVWSLGVILYEILSGRPPFNSSDPIQVRVMAMSGEVKPIAADVPPELTAIAIACLRRDPHQRYATALGVSRDIDAWLQGRLVGVHDYSPRELMTRFLRVWRVQLSAGLVALASTLLVVGLSYVRVKDARDAAVDSKHELLVARSLELFGRDARSEAEIFSASALLDRESPIARGVLAGWGAQDAPVLLESVERPCARPTFVSDSKVTCWDGAALSLWEWGASSPRWTVEVGEGDVYGLPESSAIVVAYLERPFLVLEMKSGERIREIHKAPQSFFVAVGGSEIAVNWDGVIHRADVRSGQRTEHSPCGDERSGPLPGVFDEQGLTFQCSDGRLVLEGEDGVMRAVGDERDPELATSLVRLDAQRVLNARPGLPMVIRSAEDGSLIREIPAVADRPRAAFAVGDAHAVLHAGTSGAWLVGTRSDYRLQLPMDVTSVYGDKGTQFVTMGNRWERWRIGASMASSYFDGKSGITSVSESADGRWLGITHSRGATVYHRKTGELRAARVILESVTKDGDFGDSGSDFVAVGMHGQYLRLDPEAGTSKRVAEVGPLRRVRRFSDGTAVVLGYSSSGPRVGVPGDFHGTGSTRFHDVGLNSERTAGGALDNASGLWRVTSQGSERVADVGDDARAVDLFQDAWYAIGRASTLSWGATGTEVSVPVDSTVMDVAISGDGRWIASGHVDGAVRVWSVSQARLQAIIQGHGQLVASVEFSEDGKRIVSASWDRTARIWDARALDGDPEALLSSVESRWGRTLEDILGR